MSWLFSQALVAEYSAATCSDGARSALLSKTPMLQAFSYSDKTTECSQLSQYGMTCEPLMETLGSELLTWYLVDSLARTSATQAKRPESLGSDPAYGRKCHASLARYDPDSFSWKTSQRCLVEKWASFLGTWPRWGLMLDGECWEVFTFQPLNQGSASGLWPTLKASDGEQYSKNLEYFNRRRKIAPDLPVMVGLTTDKTAKGFYGRLNPDWCEWLMGWPAGWTELKPLEMAKFREWQLQHSAYCQAQQIQTGEK